MPADLYQNSQTLTHAASAQAGRQSCEELQHRAPSEPFRDADLFGRVDPVNLEHHGALLGARADEAGHEVRLMPAKDVKAYVKRHKNDAADAEAICEAVRRPTMRF